MRNSRIAFIGTGVMGRSMASHLLAAGHDLYVYNRTKSKAQDLLNQGAHWCESPAEASSKADVAITIVGFPQDVEETYFGAQGVFAGLKQGGLAIDMTTSSPRLAQRIASEASSLGIQSLDAPVSGGDLGAREARLSIMVGGEESAFVRARPLFDIMGKTIVYQGTAGAGQHTKMCNQIAIASGMVAVAEALAYAKASGLDPEVVLQSIETGAAGSWSLSNLAPRALKDDFAPGFFIKHFIKDMGIALESAREMNLSLPGLSLAKQLYDQLAEEGAGDDGTQAIARHYWETYARTN